MYNALNTFISRLSRRKHSIGMQNEVVFRLINRQCALLYTAFDRDFTTICDRMHSMYSFRFATHFFPHRSLKTKYGYANSKGFAGANYGIQYPHHSSLNFPYNILIFE